MSNPVHILLVEDVVADAELAQHEIRKAVKDVVFQQVDTQSEFLKALEIFQPDVILSDYGMPRFDGLKALELALSHAPLTPFIIWTGSLSEDIAVSCMKAGATNYILKENIKRLGPAVVHALGERQLLVERKQAEEKIRAQERHFRALIENSLDNISLLARDGTLLWENPAVNRTLGYKQDEFVKRNIFELMHPDDLKWTQNLFAKVVQKPGTHENGIFRLLHQDGSWRWIEAVATNLLEEPSVTAVVINYRDITERRQAEIEIQRRNDDLGVLNAINEAVIRGEHLNTIVDLLTREVKRIFSSVGSTIYLLDPDGQSVTIQQYEMSPALVKGVEGLIGGAIPLARIPIKDGGFFQEALRSRRGLIMSDPHEIQKWMEEFTETDFLPSAARGVIRKLIPQMYKLLNIKSTIVVPLISNGRAIGLMDVSSADSFTEGDLERLESIGRQLTAALQRQQANNRIQRSEEFLQNVQNALSASIAILDEEGTIVRVNSTWRKFGDQNGLLHPESGVGLNYLAVCDSAVGPNAKEAQSVAKAIRDVLAGRMVDAQVEYPCHGPGEKRWFVLRITKFDEGDRNWIVLAHENISERKQAELAMHESEARYRSLFENSPIAIWEEDFSEVKKHIDSLKQQGITDFRAYFESYPEETVRCKKMIKILDLNNAALEMYEADSKEELIRVAMEDFSTGEMENIVEDLVAVAEGRTSHTWEGEDETLTGKPLEISLTRSLGPGHEKDYSKVIVTTVDITERKQAELALHESEVRYRNLFENSPVAIWEEDFSEVKKYLDTLKQQGITDFREYFVSHPEEVTRCNLLVRISNVNNTAVKMFDASSKEALLEFTNETTSQGEQDHNHEDFVAIAEGKVSNSWEGEDVKFTGETVKINLAWSVVQGYEDDYSKVIVTTMDITERVKAEDALLEAEAKYRSLVERLPVTVYTAELGIHGRWTYISPQVEPLLGFTSEEWMADPELWYQQIHPDDRDRHQAVEEQAWLQGGSFDSEYRILRKDGRQIWIRDIGIILPAPKGGVPIVQGTFTDVTERKQAGDALRQSEERFRSLFDRMMDGVYQSTHEGRFVDVNPAMVKMFGYSDEEEMLAIDIKKELYFLPEERGSHLLDTGQEETDIYRMRRKDGSEIWVEDHGSYVHDDHGNILYHEGILRDITERVKAEQALTESQERYKSLFENSPISLWEEDFSQVKTYFDQLRDSGITDFRAYFDEHPEAVTECARSVKILDVNRATLDLMEIEDKADLGTTLAASLSEDALSSIKAELTILAEGGQLYEGEEVFYTKLGNKREVIFRLTVAPGYAETLGKVFVSIMDITERKQAEIAEREQRALAEALRDTAETLNSTLDYGDVLDHILTVVGRVVPHDSATIMLIENGSAHVARSHGYEKRGFDAEVMDVELPLDETANLRQMLETKQPLVIPDIQSDVGWKKIRSTEWLLSNVGAPILIFGEVIGFILLDSEVPGFFNSTHAKHLEAFANQAALAIHNARLLQQAQNEIAERRQAEDELKRSHSLLNAALEATKDGILVVGNDRKVSSFNRKFLELWKIPYSLAKKKDDRALLDAILDQLKDPKEFIDRVNELYETPEADSFEELEFKDGRVFERHSQPQRLGNAVVGRVWSFRDITERKRAEEQIRSSEERFRQLAENIQEVFWMTDAVSGDEIYLSPASESIWGRSVETMLHDRNAFLESVLEEDRPFVRQALGEQRSGKNTEIEYRIVHTDGSVRWIWDRAFPIFDDSGKTVRLAGIAADITERKQAEAELRESEQKIQDIIRHSSSMFYTHTVDQELTYVSPQSREILDCEPEEAMRRWQEWLSDNPVNIHGIESTERAIRTGERQPPYELELITSLGRKIWVRVDESPVLQNGDTVAIIGSITDITERKRAESALRESEERYRQLLNVAPIGVGVHIDGRLVFSNDTAARIVGAGSSQALIGLPFMDFVHPDEQQGSLETLQRMLGGESGLYPREERFVKLDGSIIHVEVTATQLAYIGRPAVQVIVQDITGRKHSEEQLRKLSRAVEQSASAIVITDLGGHIEYVNPKFTEVTGYTFDETIGQNPRILKSGHTPPQEYERLWETIKAGDDWHGELLNRKKDGGLYWESAIISPIINEHGETTHYISVKEDITERKQNEAEIKRHLDELEALYENGLAVGRLLEPHEIGERIIDTFNRHLSWHHVTIRLLKDENPDELELVAHSVPHLKESQTEAVKRKFVKRISKVGQGLSGWVAQTGKPIRTGNVHDHPQYVSVYKSIQSGLYMPLTVGERTIGVISVESENADAFSPQDERLLATLASQAAVAFENARLYQSAQRELAERKRVENELRSSETHYRELADSITDVFFELDQELRSTHWNKASEMLTGVAEKDAIGRTVHEIFGDSEEQSRIANIYESVLRSHHPRTFETTFIVNNAKQSFEGNAYPSTRGVAVMVKDVTERRRSEILMQKRFELMEYSAHNPLDELMRKTIDEINELTGSKVGFFHFIEDDQNTLGMQAWSIDALGLFNMPSGEGTHHFPVDQAGAWAEAVRQRRPLIHNAFESLPGRKGMPEGHVPIVREMVIPIIRTEKIMAVLGVANKSEDYTQQDLEIVSRLADYGWDIIERKRMQIDLADERNQLAQRVEERTAELIKANTNLARALRVKDEFLANMSHELRTPLNAILGLSESLGEQVAGPLNEKQQKYITTIGESGHHLLSLINDILDLAKIEAGQITLDINKVDVHSVCQASLRMVKQLAQKKNQEVLLKIDVKVGLMWADERRLKQMIVNLLSNAVKFTPENGILGLDVHGYQDENRVEISVWDNGIGISDVNIPYLFQPFVQLDSGLARETTGTGLGLALVSQMARLHGGSVSVASETGKGSRFTISLPWEPTLPRETVERLRNTGKLGPLPTDPGNKKKILLVEDTVDVVMMIKDYLETVGYEVATAEDGIEALNQAKLTHPDLILMDVQMPRMDGIEAAKRLRVDPQFKYVPIIALTALAMPNDRERCIEAGMDEYISKPVNLRMLVRLVQKCLLSGEEKTNPI